MAGGEVEAAVEKIRDLASNASRDLFNESIMLSARQAQATRDRRRGLVSDDDADRQRAKIAQSALGLIDELQEKLTAADVPVDAPVIREATTTLVAPQVEKIIGINNLKQIAWLDQGVRCSRAVCRVLTPKGVGSGFLISPEHIMTNNHVIPDEDAARGSKVEFNYQMSFGSTAQPNSVRYELDPDRFFRTSAISALDYTVVAVKPPAPNGTATTSWGVLTLNPEADPVTGEHVIIVQHPNGGPKQIVLTANSVLRVKSPLLHYSTDTMRGSSGSPVFNDLWQVIAIHHAEGPTVAVADGTTQHSNEGILMSAIVPDLGTGWQTTAG